MYEEQNNFLEFLLYLNEIPTRAPKINLRDVENPLELHTEEQFILRYRFSKSTITSVIYHLIRASFETTTGRGNPLPPMLKLLVVLRFFATGSYQIVCGDLCGISQPSVCQLVKKISLQLALKLPIFIKFPNEAKARENKIKFKRMANFPGVVGCIDCTHIPIQNPNRRGGEMFRNRKGHFSINVQLVGGPDGEILDLVARWPGSTHDSRVFDNSSVKVKFETQAIKGILLGDSAYSQTEYLFTPVLNPETEAESRYNNAHIATRQSVERLFGVWKRRFPCLSRKMANKITTVTYIISACAVLHNISLQCKEREIICDDDTNYLENDILPEFPQVNGQRNRGALIKKNFINQHFQ